MFGNIQSKIRSLQLELDQVQQAVSTSPRGPIVHAHEEELSGRLMQEKKKKGELWRLKSRKYVAEDS